MGTTDYYIEMTNNPSDMEHINWMLNCALKDQKISASDFEYLETVAKSLGFIWSDNFVLL